MAKRKGKTLAQYKREADSVAARELELHIANEADLYPSLTAVRKNLINKKAAGKYRSGKAWKAFLPIVDRAAKSYNRLYGDPNTRGYGPFDKATRVLTAAELVEQFEEGARIGEWDYLLYKKYQKKGKRRNPKPGDAEEVLYEATTRGGKHSIALVKSQWGYAIKTWSRGSLRGGTKHLGSASKMAAKMALSRALSDSAYDDGVRYTKEKINKVYSKGQNRGYVVLAVSGALNRGYFGTVEQAKDAADKHLPPDTVFWIQNLKGKIEKYIKE